VQKKEEIKNQKLKKKIEIKKLKSELKE